MRLIGEFNNQKQAQLFSDYLTHLKIENKIEQDNKIFEVWVHAEDQIKHSEKLYKKFITDPDNLEYKRAQKKANQIKKEKKREENQKLKYVDVRTKLFHQNAFSMGKLTLILIIISIGVSIIYHFISKEHIMGSLFMAKISPEGTYYLGLQEIQKGEIWRLITPVFVHFGFLHILFNMLWLRDLGSMVEDRKGPIFLGLFIIIVACISNLAEYYFSGPLFGGMSGVVYGLLGYIWMKGKFDPNSQLSLNRSTVIMMIIWYFICFTGIVGSIANAAHTGGLVMGIAWGYLSSLRLFRKQ